MTVEKQIKPRKRQYTMAVRHGMLVHNILTKLNL